ncbi:MAG: hypothetical protein NVS1B14_01060 [Vulcanimicrobiaceae bacterium]
MQHVKAVLGSFLAGAAFFGANPTGARSPSIGGTYAAVTSRTVELLELREARGRVSGTYRVLHLDPAQRDGVSDQRLTLSGFGTEREHAFNLADARMLILRFDRDYRRAEARGARNIQTQSFERVTTEQAGLLLEMARYGGLYETCQARQNKPISTRTREFCSHLRSQLARIVPFRPFPQRAANRPVLTYEVRARLNRTLVIRR